MMRFNQALLPSPERCAYHRFPNLSSRRCSCRVLKLSPRCDQSVFTVLLVAHCMPLSLLLLFSRHDPYIGPSAQRFQRSKSFTQFRTRLNQHHPFQHLRVSFCFALSGSIHQISHHFAKECWIHSQQRTKLVNLQCCCSTEAETGFTPTSAHIFAERSFLTQISVLYWFLHPKIVCQCVHGSTTEDVSNPNLRIQLFPRLSLCFFDLRSESMWLRSVLF